MKSWTKVVIAILACLSPVLASIQAFAEPGTDVPPPERIFVTCSSDRLFVYQTGTVTLSAYVNPRDPGTYSYTWAVSNGMVEGDGPKVTWHLDSLTPGMYQAKVDVSDGHGRSGSAAVVVTAIKPDLTMGTGPQTGRSFLQRGRMEESGFGLYSYLLFGSRLGSEKRARCLSAIVEFLKFDAIADLEIFLKEKKQLNITYLFLANRVPAGIKDKIGRGTEEGFSQAAEWILANYDYARSEVLLRSLGLDSVNGPYITSFQSPLSTDVPSGSPYIFQDLTDVPANLISLWVNMFVLQAAQEPGWQRGSMNFLVLRMRTYLGTVGEALPTLLSALSTVIQVKDKL